MAGTLLDSVGIYELVNPFLLIFLIFYATLSFTKILSDKKNINIAFSLVVGILSIIAHITGIGPDIVPIINTILPSFALIAVVSFCAILLAAVIGVKVNKYFISTLLAGLVAIDLIVPDVLILALFARGLGIELPGWLSWLQSPEFWPTVIAAAAVFLAIAFIYKDKKR